MRDMPEVTNCTQTPSPEDPARRPRRAVRPPEPDPAEPPPLGNPPPPNWAGPEPEYEDEEPGAYLKELGVGTWNVIWAALNLALTLGAGLYGLVGVAAEWQFLADVAWKLLPISCAVLLLITLWQKSSAYTENTPGKSRWTLLLSCAALVLWLILGEGLD